MPVSAEELTDAKKAYGVIREFEYTRFLGVLWGCLLSFEALLLGPSLAHGTPLNGKLLQEHSAFFVYFALEIYLVIKYRDLRLRFTESLELVSRIEKEHAGELPYGLENEIQKESQKRPLLWRLDALLTRKSIIG